MKTKMHGNGHKAQMDTANSISLSEGKHLPQQSHLLTTHSGLIPSHSKLLLGGDPTA